MGVRFIQIVKYTENLEILDKLRKTFILRILADEAFSEFVFYLKSLFL